MLADLQDSGLDFDFVNGQRILAGHIDRGVLRVGPMGYRVVILPRIETIEPAVLARLRDFCRAGGTAIALERVPDRAPGLVDAAGNSRLIQELGRELFGNPTEADRPPWRGELRARGNKCGTGEGILVLPDPYQSLAPRSYPLARAVAKIVPPDLLIEPRDSDIGFVYRESAESKIFFIANVSPQEKRLRAWFPVADWTPFLFDAMSGSVEPLHQYRQEDKTIEADLTLRPWDSIFVVFRQGPPVANVTDTNVRRVLRVTDRGEVVEAEVEHNGVFRARTSAGLLSAEVYGLPAPLRLGGPWRLRVNEVNKELAALVSWTDLADLRGFSGTVSYRVRFVLPAAYLAADTRLALDLGEVRDIAEVRVNGKDAGLAWKRPYVVDITGAVKAGINELEVRVTNSLMNRMRVKEPTAADRPPAMSPQMMREYVPEPVVSGLLGPVQVRALRRITMRARGRP